MQDKLESRWFDELCSIAGVAKHQLPILWDAEFLYGAKDGNGADTFVLCEINVSSVYPFPDHVLAPLAREVRTQLERLRS